MQFLRNPWIDVFNDLVGNAEQSIKIAAPYVKSNVIKQMLFKKQKQTSLSLITSFKLQNYYRGASDLDALDNIIDIGGAVSNYQKLHAKIYLFDEKIAVITSANLTSNGLFHNYEYGVLVDELVTVQQIANDYKALLADEITGKVTKNGIASAREVLANTLKQPATHFPDFKYETQEDDDVYTAGVETIVPALSGWTLAVFNCLSKLDNMHFTTEDTALFIPTLKSQYPNNNFIEDKIRQQLQMLRDRGLVEFLGRGQYYKLWN